MAFMMTEKSYIVLIGLFGEQSWILSHALAYTLALSATSSFLSLSSSPLDTGRYQGCLLGISASLRMSEHFRLIICPYMFKCIVLEQGLFRWIIRIVIMFENINLFLGNLFCLWFRFWFCFFGEIHWYILRYLLLHMFNIFINML